MSPNRASLAEVATEIAQGLSSGVAVGRSMYITTSASYANGTRVCVRVDQHGEDEYFVTDDGFAYDLASMQGGASAFSRVGPKVAEQAGVGFDRQSFYASLVAKDRLPGAVVAVANASQRALERAMFALEERRVVQSRDIFVDRIKEAFGGKAVFDVEMRGRSGKDWRVDAAIEESGDFRSTFFLVRPSTIGIASAHLKTTDIRSLFKPPHITVALTNYQKTDPELRLILSGSADAIIAANDDRVTYLQSA